MSKEDMSREEVVEKWKGVLSLGHFNTNAYVGIGLENEYKEYGCIEGASTQILATEIKEKLNIICYCFAPNGSCPEAGNCKAKEQENVLVSSIDEVFKNRRTR